ncbi:MAG: peptidylprolyl isomerase [Verrucomicrobiota bacterium]
MNGLSSILRKLHFLALLTVAFPAFADYTNGIYAEFNTSMGSYTCRLDYAIAPKAVANFIGLATGGRAWLDFPSGTVRTNPFYNGTTFHRVIAGFMNQGGSPNGLGTDGPGYQFVDEFTNTARFTGFGVLAMANSGPDSNGSQYFITVSPQPSLSDVHTIFGQLYGGSNVVYAINHVATNSTNSKPLTDVVVQSVAIRRVGAEAQAFDINAQGLPVVTNLNCSISQVSSNVVISFSNALNIENRFYSSTNLQSWSGVSFGIETKAPLLAGIQAGGSLPSRFFRMIQVRYPPTLNVPKNVLGRTIVLSFTNGLSGLIVNLSCDAVGGATYVDNASHSGGAVYAWKQDAYRGRLVPLYLESYSYAFGLHLDFDSPTVGSFKGTAYQSYPSVPVGSVAGTFTASP